jgi:hypothetical protein
MIRWRRRRCIRTLGCISRILCIAFEAVLHTGIYHRSLNCTIGWRFITTAEGSGPGAQTLCVKFYCFSGRILLCDGAMESNRFLLVGGLVKACQLGD